MPNTYLRNGAPGRTSIVIEDSNNNKALLIPPVSIVIVPLLNEIPSGEPICFISAIFTARGSGAQETFALWPLSEPLRYPSFLKFFVIPTDMTLARHRQRKQTPMVGGGSGTVTGSFTITLRVGPPNTPEESCDLQGTLYEE